VSRDAGAQIKKAFIPRGGQIKKGRRRESGVLFKSYIILNAAFVVLHMGRGGRGKSGLAERGKEVTGAKRSY